MLSGLKGIILDKIYQTNTSTDTLPQNDGGRKFVRRVVRTTTKQSLDSSNELTTKQTQANLSKPRKVELATKLA